MRTFHEDTLGMLIRYTRNLNGMTLHEAAEASGLSIQYIGEVERGSKGISLQKAEEILTVLDTSFDHSDSLEEERKNELILFIKSIYAQNDKIAGRTFHVSYDYGFLYSLMKTQLFKVLIQNDLSEFLFIESSIGDLLMNIQGLIGSTYLFLRSVKAMKKANLEQAKRTIEKALELIGKDRVIEPLLYMQYGAILERQNQYISACKASYNALDYAVENGIFPLIELLKMNIAIDYVKLKSYDEAIELFDSVIEMNTQIENQEIHLKCLINKMQTIFLKQDIEEALSEAKEIIQKYPDCIEAQFVYALCELLNGTGTDSVLKWMRIYATERSEYKILSYLKSEMFGHYNSDIACLNRYRFDYFIYHALRMMIKNEYIKNNDYEKLGHLFVQSDTITHF